MRFKPYGLSFRGKSAVFPLASGRAALCRRRACHLFSKITRADVRDERASPLQGRGAALVRLVATSPRRTMRRTSPSAVLTAPPRCERPARHTPGRAGSICRLLRCAFQTMRPVILRKSAFFPPASGRTALVAAPRFIFLEQFQFETLRVSNHTTCRFAEKARFFRSLRAGRRCAAASRFTFFKGETL